MRLRLTPLKCAIVTFGLVYATSAVCAQTQEILWSELRPANQGPSDPFSEVAKPGPGGETLPWNHDSTIIKLTGFVLPVDSEGDLVYEFLLVPVAGACSHMPAPPANQIIHVFPKTPFHITKSYEFVSITGALQPGLDESQLFVVDGVKVVEYGYSMRQAQVSKQTERRDPSLKGTSAWSFL